MSRDLLDYLNEVDYKYLLTDYRPSQFALEFVNFIKLVNGSEGEEHASPVIHYDMIDQLMKSRQNLFVSFRGSAKALALDTLVMTPTGYVPMRYITVGDLVIDRNGEATEVVCESGVFTNQCYRITLADGNEFIANEDHYHVVQRRTQEPDHSKPKRANGTYSAKNVWVEEELTTKEILAKGPICNENLSNKSKWYIPLINKPVEFNSEKPQMDPYTVGVILGDGGICKDTGAVRITSHVDDVEELMSYIPYELGEVFEDKRHPSTKRFGIVGIAQILKKFIGVNDTYSKEIPEQLLFGSIEDRIRVLQGLMDTDGSITPQGSHRFISVSKALAQGVEHIVKSLGGYCKVSHYDNAYAGYYTVAFSIPGVNPFRLKRKAARWQNKHYMGGERVGIVAITPIGEAVESKCISVASDTRTFLLENSVITRNTTALHEYMILYLATYGRIPGFGEVHVGMYISDTIDNGVKSMRTNLQYRWSNSEFLQLYVPVTRFTDVRWEFENVEQKKLCFRGFGASPLALDEVVHTPEGIVAIGDIQVGDKVYGSDGKLANVTTKSGVFYKDMYRITLKDGRTLKVSHDHLNSVYVKVNHKFVKKVITTEEMLRKSLKFAGKNEYRYAIPVCSPIEYPTKDLEVDPYTLGLMLGDGSSRPDGSNTLTGCLKDLEFYKKHIPYRFGVLYEDKRYKGVGSLTIKGLYKGMRKLGIQGCITYDKFIPKEYKTASVEQRLELLKGLMDTDGTVYGNSRVSFTNTSRQLVDDVKNIVESLGGYTSLKVNPANRREFREYSSDCKESYTLSIFIPLNIFKVPRKASKFKANKLHDKVAVTALEKIEQVPSQCIGLDNDNHEFVSTNYFVTHNTGVRGFKEYGKRPTWVGYDDLMSDKNAESATITKDIKHIIYKAARQALHPSKRMQIWTGTPFNKADPLYEATANNAWNVRTYPICEKFPCTEEEFQGAWEDRFSYDFVKHEYESLLESGEIASFNQELMLRITSDEDRLIQDHDLVWYERKQVLKNRSSYNFYITTDLATSNQEKSDFTVIGVWAYSSNHDWMLVDGICARQLMDKSMDDLFRFVSMYKPLSVGIEINGQQGGFIQWMKNEMLTRKIFFSFAGKKGVEGIRRTRPKIEYMKTFLPVIKAKKLWLPEEMRDSPLVQEILEEFRYVTTDGFKSKNDDASDMVTMLQELDPFAPTEEVNVEYLDSEDGNFAFSSPEDDKDIYKNNLVF